MNGRPLDDEIAGGFGRTRHLGPDAGVARLQRAVRQIRVVAPDRPVKLLLQAGFERIVRCRQPAGHVRPELALAAEIKRDVNAQAGVIRHRVHQMSERRPPAQREVVALGVKRRRHPLGRKTGEGAGHVLGVQAGRIDQPPATQRERFFPAGVQRDSIRHNLSGHHRGAGDQRRAGPLGVAQQRQHQAVAVEDAGRFRIQPGDRPHRRFQAADFGGGERPERHAVGRRPLGVTGQRRQFRFLAGHQHLADPAMGDTALGAVAIQQRLASHAQLGLERTRRVVEAGVDDFGVMRRGLSAELLQRFQDQHLATGVGQFSGHR